MLQESVSPKHAAAAIYTINSEGRREDEEEEEEQAEDGCPLEELEPQDLEAIAVIYDNIRVLRRMNSPRFAKNPKAKEFSFSDKELAAQFDEHLQAIMGQLSSDIEAEELGGDGDGLGKGGHILRAKLQLMDILGTKMGEYLMLTEGQAARDIVEGVCEQYKRFLSQALELGSWRVRRATEAKDKELHALRSSYDRVKGQLASLTIESSKRASPNLDRTPQLEARVASL